MNPVAIILFLFGASVGFAMDNIHGASVGVAITTGMSLVVSFFRA